MPPSSLFMNATAARSAALSSGNAPAAPASWLIIPMRIGSPLAATGECAILPSVVSSPMQATTDPFLQSSPPPGMPLDPVAPLLLDSLQAPRPAARRAIPAMSAEPLRLQAQYRRCWVWLLISAYPSNYSKAGPPLAPAAHIIPLREGLVLPGWYIGSLMATALAYLSSARIDDLSHLSIMGTATALRRVIIIP